MAFYFIILHAIITCQRFSQLHGIHKEIPSDKTTSTAHNFPKCESLAAQVLRKSFVSKIFHNIQYRQHSDGQTTKKPLVLAICDASKACSNISTHFYGVLPSKLIPRVEDVLSDYLDHYLTKIIANTPLDENLNQKSQLKDKAIGQLYLLANIEKDGNRTLAEVIKAKYPDLPNRIHNWPKYFVSDELIQYALQSNTPLLKSLVASKIYVAGGITYAAAYHNAEAIKICIQQIKDIHPLHIHDMSILEMECEKIAKENRSWHMLRKPKEPNVLTMALVTAHPDRNPVNREKLKSETITLLLEMVFNHSLSPALLEYTIDYLLASHSYMTPKVGNIQVLQRSEALRYLINTLYAYTPKTETHCIQCNRPNMGCIAIKDAIKCAVYYDHTELLHALLSCIRDRPHAIRFIVEEVLPLAESKGNHDIINSLKDANRSKLSKKIKYGIFFYKSFRKPWDIR